MLCDTASGDVQESPIWGLGSIGGDADEVEISTVSTTQCPAHSHIHSSTDIFREVNTGEGGDSGGTWRNELNWHEDRQHANCKNTATVSLQTAWNLRNKH